MTTSSDLSELTDLEATLIVGLTEGHPLGRTWTELSALMDRVEYLFNVRPSFEQLGSSLTRLVSMGMATTSFRSDRTMVISSTDFARKLRDLANDRARTVGVRDAIVDVMRRHGRPIGDHVAPQLSIPGWSQEIYDAAIARLEAAASPGTLGKVVLAVTDRLAKVLAWLMGRR